MKNNFFFKILIKNTEKISQSISTRYFKNKIITITGGSGLIGSHFIGFFYNLLKTDNKPRKIYIIHRSNIPDYLTFLKKNKYFFFIKSNLAKSTKKIPKSDIIIHAAGYAQPQKFIEKGIETLLLNSKATYELIIKLKHGGKFLFLSSSEIYSGLEGDVTEEKVGNTNTDHGRACYIEGKRFGETIVHTLRKKNNIDAKSARVCLAYGAGVKKDDARVMSQFVDSALKFNHINLQDDGSAIRSYIFVGDVILMLLKIMLFGKQPTYNIGGKNKTSIKNLAMTIGKILNADVSFKKKQLNSFAPKSAFVSIKNYEKEFGIIKLTKLSKGLEQVIEWHKLLKKI